MTGDINIFYYEYMLRNIIKTGKHNEESWWFICKGGLNYG
jgi:hypothetical protein